jgi:hypothetical protein
MKCCARAHHCRHVGAGVVAGSVVLTDCAVTARTAQTLHVTSLCACTHRQRDGVALQTVSADHPLT